MNAIICLVGVDLTLLLSSETHSSQVSFSRIYYGVQGEGGMTSYGAFRGQAGDLRAMWSSLKSYGLGPCNYVWQVT